MRVAQLGKDMGRDICNRSCRGFSPLPDRCLYSRCWLDILCTECKTHVCNKEMVIEHRLLTNLQLAEGKAANAFLKAQVAQGPSRVCT